MLQYSWGSFSKVKRAKPSKDGENEQKVQHVGSECFLNRTMLD